MKRLLALFFVICALSLGVCACSSGGAAADGNSKEQTDAAEKVTTAVETDSETASETAPAAENEKPVKLYLMDYSQKLCLLVTEYESAWSADEDIATFGTFNTDEESFSFESETEAHRSLWNAESTEENYKIGYEISLTLKTGEAYTVTVKNPQDILDAQEEGILFGEDAEGGNVTGYMGVWVYDDINQEGTWYSHILPEEVTEETLLTSIKLRPTPESGEIESFYLTAFTYADDTVFDGEGHYKGSYGYSIAIINTNV